MKKTLIIMLSAATTSLAIAQGSDWQRELIYGLDFNGSVAGDSGLTPTNKADASHAGSTPLGYDQSFGNFNYSNDVSGLPIGSDYLYGHKLNGRTFKFADSAGLDGIDYSRGFAISVAGVGAADWKNLIAFTYGGTDFELQYNANDGITLYGGSEPIVIGLTGANTWHNFGISVSGSELTLTVIDINGNVLGNVTKDFGFTSDDLLTEIGGATGNRKSDTYMDNFAIYNGSLEQEHFETIASNTFAGLGLTQTIPEPATATLSLFALAGLMARRRRQSA